METNLARFLKRKRGRSMRKRPGIDEVAYDAASFSEDVRSLNPFYSSGDVSIPVPGQAGMTSNSVEAVWQGLKIVDGKTDFSMFHGNPYKRPTGEERRNDPNYRYEDSKFLYGTNVVDLVTARKVIYVPAYRYLFDNFVPLSFKDQVKEQLDKGIKVFFYDWDDNPNIDDTTDSFAHASLLVQLMNEYASPKSASFDVHEIGDIDPFNIGMERKQKISNYSGRIQKYIEQIVRANNHVTEETVLATDYVGVKSYKLSSGNHIILSSKGVPYGNRKLEVKTETEEGVKTIAEVKRMKVFLTDLLARSFVSADITPGNGEDILQKMAAEDASIEGKLKAYGKIADSMRLAKDQHANLSYYRLEDMSYVFLIADNWNQNRRLKVFAEKGTLGEKVVHAYGAASNLI
jgi:hypothetical protein